MTKERAYPPLWRFFDKVYCINLQERPDRKREAEKEFKKVGLSDKVEFYTVKRHPFNIEQGIYESHMACIEKGLKENAETIVIFEDDIVFDRFRVETLKGCIAFMTSGRSWNMLFFGCLVNGVKKTDYPSVLKIRYRSLTQGYVISRRYAEKFVKHKWAGISYDGFLHDVQDNFYAACPSFAFQSNSESDNLKYLKLDRFRRVFGGLKPIQKLNELFFRYPVTMITVHFLLIICFIWVVF